MNNKLYVTMTLFLLLLAPWALAGATERMQGDITLAWSNYPDRPQHFDGTVTGDLEGTISLVSTTDYDNDADQVGVTHAEIEAELNDETCEGFYAGANVNAGRNAGTFSLWCSDDAIIQGSMFGVNDQYGGINAEYDAFRILPLKGDKGDQGEQGIQGEPGADGVDGIDGADGLDGADGQDGQDGINGIDGINGLDGLDGAQGPKGDQGETGAQGIQGIPGEKGDEGAKGDTGAQGIQGLKGDTGATGAQGPQGIQGLKGDKGDKGDSGSDAVCATCLADAKAYTDSKVAGLASVVYVDQRVQEVYDYVQGNVFDNCNAKDTKSCSGNYVADSDYYCKLGHGTDTRCIKGKCELKYTKTKCQFSCASGVCSAPTKWSEMNCKDWCKAGNAVPASPCNTYSTVRHYVEDHKYCVWS